MEQERKDFVSIEQQVDVAMEYFNKCSSELKVFVAYQCSIPNPASEAEIRQAFRKLGEDGSLSMTIMDIKSNLDLEQM